MNTNQGNVLEPDRKDVNAFNFQQATDSKSKFFFEEMGGLCNTKQCQWLFYGDSNSMNQEYLHSVYLCKVTR